MRDSDKLVATLRNIAQYCRPFPISEIAGEAADEIERLRKAASARPLSRRAPDVINPAKAG